MVRIHDAEMYLVTIIHICRDHSEKVIPILLTDDLLIALNTARTAEMMGFNITTGNTGAFIYRMLINVENKLNEPIFERRWLYKKTTGNKKTWIEKWHSSAHKALAEKNK